jgi:hypothetical protein
MRTYRRLKYAWRMMRRFGYGPRAAWELAMRTEP